MKILLIACIQVDINLMHVPAWSFDDIWIGGASEYSGKYYWDGVLNSAVPMSGTDQSDWHGDYPYKNAACIALNVFQGWFVDEDYPCDYKLLSVCEKIR